MSEADPYDSVGYQEFVARSAKACRCCRVCCSPPCDGVLAGGMCDEARCSCDDEPESMEDDDGCE